MSKSFTLELVWPGRTFTLYEDIPKKSTNMAHGYNSYIFRQKNTKTFIFIIFNEID